MTYRTIILFLTFIFVLSCKQTTKNKPKSLKKCEAKISSFDYPADLENLINLNYKCDVNLPFIKNDNRKFTKNLHVIFSDQNYSLIHFDRKTRLLWDKREDIIFVFKACEIDNFYYNKPGYKELYPLTIYILNKELIPIFHLQGDQISVFQDDKENKKLKEFRIELENKSLIKNIDNIKYDNLIMIIKDLKSNKYLRKDSIGGSLLEYFYINPPIWTEQ